MTAKRRTIEHLNAAARNQRLAHALLGIMDIQPAPYDWAVVIGFYAAVHYVNAYLWEQLGYEPRNHYDRISWVNRVKDLQPAARSYNLLFDYSLKVRYDPAFRLSRADALDVLTNDLSTVERAVRSALNNNP